MSSDGKKTILKLKISEKLKKDLNDIAKRHNIDINELIIQTLEECVINKNNNSTYTKEEWDKIMNEVFPDKNPKEERPRDLTFEEIDKLLSSDSFWDN